MERDGRRSIVYPPIHEEINQWGETVYRVVFSDHTESIIFLVPPPTREEALERVHEILRRDLREGRYRARDFYPPHAQDASDDGEREQHCLGGVGGGALTPASGSGEAAVAAPPPEPEITTSVNKDGELCSVCLQEFEAGSRLRAMPCAHVFHEKCISNWLRVGRACPLCRFPLPPAKPN